MLSSIILDQTIPSVQEALIHGSRVVTWRELRSQARRMLTAFERLRAHRVGLSMRATAESFAALAALDRIGVDTFLFDGRMPVEEMFARARSLKLGAILVSASAAEGPGFEVKELAGEREWSGSSTVTILTSGSTGEPKAARHTWETLSRPVRKGAECVAPRWLLAYRPNLYAGLQVMLQCFADRGTLVIPSDEVDPRALGQLMSDAKLQYVSATPSFWRRLLILADSETLKKTPLVQITIGGELVDQLLLDRLREIFPCARIAHIYATTELGRCFSVHDGLAGFPTAYLDRVLLDGTQLRIHDGELQVRSSNSMTMYDPYSRHQISDGNWFSTGDLVEVKNDRVSFIGRKTDMINVAGAKVYPVEVERTIRRIPGVSDVRVFGKTSSIAGELVACEVVPLPGEDLGALRTRINQTCRASLSSPQLPRSIAFVEQIVLSAAGKTLRRSIS